MDLRSILRSSQTRVIDGAMGTQLHARGYDGGGHNSLLHPDAVIDVHRAYAESGAEILIANTLTMNRVYVESHAVQVDLADVNLAGAKLARQVAGDRLIVLGDMSSTGQMLAPYGTYEESTFVEAYAEQAKLLEQGEVDGFIIETMFDLKEALCAVRGCRQVSDLPVIILVAFTTDEKGGRTMMGDTAADCATRLAEAGADVVGANCGEIDPLQMANIIAIMRDSTDLPLAAEPNAGKPRLVDGSAQFDMGPSAFSDGVAMCVEMGALLVGGCCGTSPAHIQAIRDLLGAPGE